MFLAQTAAKSSSKCLPAEGENPRITGIIYFGRREKIYLSLKVRMYISENFMPGTAPGFVPVSAPGSAARVRAWLLCLPFQLFQVSSWQRFPFLFDYSVTNIDSSQSSRKTPAAARKAVLTLPPPSKAHTAHNAPHIAAACCPCPCQKRALSIG